jgi:hypothetical protein
VRKGCLNKSLPRHSFGAFVALVALSDIGRRQAIWFIASRAWKIARVAFVRCAKGAPWVCEHAAVVRFGVVAVLSEELFVDHAVCSLVGAFNVGHGNHGCKNYLQYPYKAVNNGCGNMSCGIIGV